MLFLLGFFVKKKRLGILLGFGFPLGVIAGACRRPTDGGLTAAGLGPEKKNAEKLGENIPSTTWRGPQGHQVRPF